MLRGHEGAKLASCLLVGHSAPRSQSYAIHPLRRYYLGTASILAIINSTLSTALQIKDWMGCASCRRLHGCYVKSATRSASKHAIH